jgi:hypothetical protein
MVWGELERQRLEPHLDVLTLLHFMVLMPPRLEMLMLLLSIVVEGVKTVHLCIHLLIPLLEEVDPRLLLILHVAAVVEMMLHLHIVLVVILHLYMVT